MPYYGHFQGLNFDKEDVFANKPMKNNVGISLRNKISNETDKL